jgi:hypothetical protein
MRPVWTAQYWRYTGDPHGLLAQYFDRIQGRVQMLMQRRAQALLLDPSDPAYGESKRLVVESPWSQFTSECQRF